QERTLAILTDAPNLNEIIECIKGNGFQVIASKHFELTLAEAEKFYQDHVKQNYYEKGIRWLSSSNLCALVLEKENAIKDWRHLMGPTTYKKARKTSPNSIRALFGKDAPQNATHGSDSDESASKEIAYMFGDMTI
ncbi:nucleoside diphosphate kinase, partial [Parasitella parasitica]